MLRALEGHSASHAVLHGLSGAHISGTPKVPLARQFQISLKNFLVELFDWFIFFPRKLFFPKNLLRSLLRWLFCPPDQASRCCQTVVAESSLEGGWNRFPLTQLLDADLECCNSLQTNYFVWLLTGRKRAKKVSRTELQICHALDYMSELVLKRDWKIVFSTIEYLLFVLFFLRVECVLWWFLSYSRCAPLNQLSKLFLLTRYFFLRGRKHRFEWEKLLLYFLFALWSFFLLLILVPL